MALTATYDARSTFKKSRPSFSEKARAEHAFHQATQANGGYTQALRSLGRQITHIVRAFAPEDATKPWSEIHKAQLDHALRRYAHAIEPWAQSVGQVMLTRADRRNRTAWRAYTEEMSLGLRQELLSADVGAAIRSLLAQQVTLITSLPVSTSQRVQEKALEAMVLSERYPERTEEITQALAEANPQATQNWLNNQATVIARTETARAQSVLVQARSETIGADQYIWRTAGDSNVRESHRKLNKSVQRWDKPPLSDPPDHYSHPGQIWNCRCVALPIIPE